MIQRPNNQEERYPGDPASWDIDTPPSLIINMSYYLLYHAASTDMLATVDLDNIHHSQLDI